MQTIIPHLWYDSNAEEAVNFYISTFNNGRILNIARYSESGAAVSGRPAGSVMTIHFELEGQQFLALNGGPLFTFSSAISFLVNYDTQEEIDRVWDALADGGEPEQCGWIRDRFGVTWQISAACLGPMLEDSDPVRAERVMRAMLAMVKIDIALLEEAYRG